MNPFRIMGFGIAVVAVLTAVVFGFLGWKVFRTAEKISIGNDSGERGGLSDLLPDGKRAPLSGEEDGRIDVLLLGRAGQGYPGKELTDTVMIASIDLGTRRAAFLSLPRDLFVPIPDTGLSTKLNSLYQYGLSRDEGADTVRRAVEDITGLDIPYYVTVDFDGFEKIVDEIGGVTVLSDRDILDTRYPGKNYAYETFELSKGWHTLDGATALKYARERHSDPEGDFGRAKRQQQILKAFQEKVFSARTLLNAPAVGRMLDTLGESVRTDLSVPEMLAFAEIIRTIDVRNASTVVVDAWKRESLLRVSHIDVGGVRAFILLPRTGNWNEVRDLAENVFELGAIGKRREAIGSERASVAIVSRPEDASVAKRLARTIEDAVPAETVATVTAASLPERERSAVAERGAARKLYTLDELVRLFRFDRVDSLPETLVPSRDIGDADLVIVVGNDLDDILLAEDAGTAEGLGNVPESDPFPEYFPAQER